MLRYPQAMRAMSDFLMCEELGGFPYTGGWREQPHSVVLYFEIIRAASAEAQEEMAKRGK